MPSQFFGDDHDGTSFQAVFSFHVNKHGNHLQPLSLHWIVAFGVTRGCLLIGGIPRFHHSLKPVCQTWTLFCLFFNHNFQTNNNQTFIVCAKCTLVLYRKGLCGCFSFGICWSRKVTWKNCCEYFRSEGVYGNLSKTKQYAIGYRTEFPDYSHLPVQEFDWERTVYGKVVEEIPKDAPDPLGNEVVTTMFLDANLMHDVLTGRFDTAMLHFFNTKPGDWYSKRQSSVENATDGSEFVAAKTATEQIIKIRQVLSYLGVPIKSKSYMFGDNNSVVTSGTIPHSLLSKDITLCLIIELESLLLPRSLCSIGVILPRTKVILSVSTGTTPKITIVYKNFSTTKEKQVYFHRIGIVYYLKKGSDMFHVKIQIFMFLRCQNHLIKNIPKFKSEIKNLPQIHPTISSSPNTRPNDSSNFYMPYKGLGPTVS